MEVKQEPFEPYEGVIKAEPNVSGQTPEGNDCSSTKRENLHKDHVHYPLVPDDRDIFCEYKPTEIKQEIIKCEEPKIGYQSSNLPAKIEYDSTTIKKELDVQNVTDINSDTFIKQEVSEFVQTKTESELLSTYCDLPTLKSEGIDYPDYYVQPCSSKNAKKTLKKLKTKANVSKKSRRYPCAICKNNFSSSKTRSKHVDGHFGKGFVVCEFCGQFVTKIDYFRHYFIHSVRNKPLKISHVSSVPKDLTFKTNEILFKCEICSRKFSTKCNLQRHIKAIHSDERSFGCNFCSKVFKDKSTLKEHLIIHTNQKPFKCEVCLKEFIRKSGMRRHFLIYHADEQPFKCTFCSKQFNRNGNLLRHLEDHSDEKPFKCEICSKRFKCKSYIQDHLLTHTNTKLFKCTICSKEFRRQRDLNTHLLIHDDEISFQCNICYKYFNRKSYLQKHYLRVHTNEKPFKCDICSTRFNCKSNLQRHLKLIHYDEKQFKCDICSKKFRTECVLENHLKIHSDERFKCDICSKKLKCKSHLQEHLLIHTKKIIQV